MKALKMMVLGLLAAIVWTACSDSKADDRYIDLTTGEPIELVKDEESGLMVNAATRKPVRMYVDTRTHDTVWGKSGKVINGYVHQDDEGQYIYIGSGDDDESDYKLKRDGEGYKKKVGDDYKVKVEDDGDYKIKDGDTKIKVDAETGKTKVKKDD
jgi:hypothetical protein